MPDIAVTDLQAATAALNAAAAQLRGDHKAMSDWSTTQGDTVTVKDEAGQDVLVPSLDYLLRQFAGLETDVRSLLGTARAPQLADYYRERDLMLAQVAASGALVREVNRAWAAGTTANLVTMPDAPEFVVAGLQMAIRNEFRFPAAPDGRDTYNRASGQRQRLSSADAAFDAEAVNTDVEVVIRRKDVWATEVWLEAITPANPHIFPGGDVHSTEATMDGFATEDSTRPDSYHAMHEGEALASQPKGVNLYAIPAAQLVVHLQNPANGLYQLPDGSYAQRRKRNKAIAGAGNGDWGTISATTNTSLQFAGNKQVALQGQLDASPAYYGESGAVCVGYGTAHASGVNDQKGVFKAGLSNKPVAAVALYGECHLIVHGEWARLNQGCFHPSLNDWGSAAVAYNYGGVVKFNAWHGTGAALTSQRQCFAGPFFYNETFTAPGRYDDTGSLSSASSMASGRPDGRFHDAAAPGGQGGIIDRRLSAYRTSQADHDREDAKVKAGTYRGLETVKRMAFVNALDTDGSQSSGIWFNGLPEGKAFSDIVAGSWVGGIRADGTGYRVGRIKEVKGDYLVMEDSVVRSSDRYLVMFEENLSVSGEFTWQTVIGNPAHLAKCTALAGGWLGNWSPDFGFLGDHRLERPVVGQFSGLPTLYTDTYGATWATAASNIDEDKATRGGDTDGVRIYVVSFTTWANMTEPCANALLRDGEAGISGTVFQQMRSAPTAGALLTASLIGKVPTDNGSGYTYGNLSYLGGTVFLGKLYPSRMPHRHEPVSLRAPLNNSPASKSLRYSHEVDGLATNCYAFAELGYSGDWGDSGEMPIKDFDSTWLDDNNITRKAGTHKLALPFGWA